MKRLFINSLAVGLLSACAHQTPEWPVTYLGEPAPPTLATKTIVIRPDTKSVNVTGGDTVRFVAGDQSFAWTFKVAYGVLTFDLSRVAPEGMLAHGVNVFVVAPDPLSS